MKWHQALQLYFIEIFILEIGFDSNALEMREYKGCSGISVATFVGVP